MGTDGSTVAAMAAHETAIKAKQSAERSSNRPIAAKLANQTKRAMGKPADDPRIAALVAWRATADAPKSVLDAVDAAIRRSTGTPRSTAPKADPKVVAAFFTSTGLSPKQIAAAVGVSTSVIGTVKRESGDRWSLARFEAAKPLILAAAKKTTANAK
jgi:hypothetical protein